MFKFLLILAVLLSFLVSCNNNISSSSSSNYYKSTLNIIDEYSKYQNLKININDIFNQNESLYGVYIYSKACPACYSIKESLFKYLEKNNASNKLYLIDLFEQNENDINKMKDTNGINEEEIINKTINATKIEELYFRSAPCIYIIEKDNNVNKVKDFLLTYPMVESFLLSD